ncbi:MAG: hypothetical protein KDD67_14795 [Ignavibacteriae bacterium]|nr:hypothetical protein [Ignavibacteriota bacterium]MCB9215122.1 hypothetical protein [Ignavibacteria bacterium]
MDTETIIIIAVILLTDALFLFVFLKVRKKKRELALNISALAAEEGWEVLPTTNSSEVYRIQGRLSTGITWEMIGERKGGSNSSGSVQNTTWRTADVQLHDGVLAFGPGIGMKAEGIDLGHGLIQRALRRMFGEELATELADAQMIEVEGEQFTRYYSVFSDQPELAHRFLAEPLPSILVDWRSEKLPFPGLVLWKEGMQVKFTKVADDPEGIQKIVSLCEVLALRGREVIT